MNYLDSHVDETVIINPSDIDALSDRTSINERSGSFPLSNTSSCAWYEYAFNDQDADHSSDIQGDNQQTPLQSPKIEGDVHIQEMNPPASNPNLVYASDLALLKGKKKRERTGNSLGPPRQIL